MKKLEKLFSAMENSDRFCTRMEEDKFIVFQFSLEKNGSFDLYIPKDESEQVMFCIITRWKTESGKKKRKAVYDVNPLFIQNDELKHFYKEARDIIEHKYRLFRLFS